MDLWRAVGYAMRAWRIGPDEADRLVAGGAPRPGERGVGALLAAAAAPSTSDELAAEAAAIGAFRKARNERARLASRRGGELSRRPSARI